MKIISVHSYKGGVGRSFTLVNLALTIDHYLKKKILVIDFDIKAPSFFQLFDVKNELRKNTLLDIFSDIRNELDDKNLSGNDIDTFISEYEIKNLEDCIVDLKGEKSYRESKNSFNKFFFIGGSNPESSNYLKNQYLLDISDKKLTIEALAINKIISFAKKELFDLVIFDFPAGYSGDSLYQGNASFASDLHIVVSNLNQQGIEGLNMIIGMNNFFQTNIHKSYKEKFNVLPVLNKVNSNHLSFEKIFKEFKAKYRYLSNFINRNFPEKAHLLDISYINFFSSAIIGEYTIKKDLFENYPLNSKFDLDIYNTNKRNDEEFRFYKEIYYIFEKVVSILYQENTEKKQVIFNNTKINLYIEDVSKEIGDKLEGLVGENNLTIQKFKTKSLESLHTKLESKSEELNIISLPNLDFKEYVKDNTIISFKDIIDRAFEKEKNPSKDKSYFYSKIQDFKRYFGKKTSNLIHNDILYGIPFTNTSTIIAFNSKLGSNLTLTDIIKSNSIKFAMMNIDDGSSHIYDFFNILFAYNYNFYDKHPDQKENFDFKDEKFKLALKDYLTLYKRAKKNNCLITTSWDKLPKGLIDNKFDACFLWTETLKEILEHNKEENKKEEKNLINFNEIYPIYSNSFSNLNGWFFACYKKDSYSYEELEQIFNFFEVVSDNYFQKILIDETYSSPSLIGVKDYLEEIKSRIKEKDFDENKKVELEELREKSNNIKFVQRVNSNFPEQVSPISKKVISAFCKTIHENVTESVETVIESILEKIKAKENE